VSEISPSPAWLEVSLTVSDELAEPVADALARFAVGGVAIAREEFEPDPDGEGTPMGPVAVRAYLPFDAELKDRRLRLEEALWHLGRITPLPEASFREIPEEDWSLQWKVHYRPMRIGRRIRIIPSWMEASVLPTDAVLRMDPGMAFGTGVHPTTQLCLAAMEERIVPGMDVFDLGCGSGILAIAAVKLGAGRAIGLDLDPQAVQTARENAIRNGEDSKIDFRMGSLDTLLEERRSAPMVVANILASVLREMLSEGLAKTVLPGGCLILSGILADQSAAVEAAVRTAGMQCMERKIREDWVALVALAPLSLHGQDTRNR
jgi:ribosomal protein L11 methyltransferase